MLHIHQIKDFFFLVSHGKNEAHDWILLSLKHVIRLHYKDVLYHILKQHPNQVSLAFFLSCQYSAKTLRFMLENFHLNANQKNSFHNHCLHICEDQECLELLATIEGLDWNARNSQGRTPLHLAVKEGNVNKMRIILDNGGSVSIRDREGMTPIQLSV